VRTRSSEAQWGALAARYGGLLMRDSPYLALPSRKVAWSPREARKTCEGCLENRRQLFEAFRALIPRRSAVGGSWGGPGADILGARAGPEAPEAEIDRSSYRHGPWRVGLGSESGRAHFTAISEYLYLIADLPCVLRSRQRWGRLWSLCGYGGWHCWPSYSATIR
jgi:hypothetical protein